MTETRPGTFETGGTHLFGYMEGSGTSVEVVCSPLLTSYLSYPGH